MRKEEHPMNEKACKILAARIRLETLKVIRSRGFGHVGGSMDLADLMAVLYGEVMKFDPKNPRWEDRDWLVLSKGHAGPVAYATFGLMGYYPMEEAYTLNQPHTKFPSHTDRLLTPGVDLTTGSLGQGVSAAMGAALGNKIDGRDSHVFVVVGDGEADEGQVWEAFHFAYAHKLDNVVVFVDKNGYQLDGSTDDILAHGDIAKKCEAFGLYTQEIDGHDVTAIYNAIQNAYAKKGVPSCIVLDTIKGKGATFAEPKREHSSQPSGEQWAEAIAASEQALAAIENA
jgi:transketolase